MAKGNASLEFNVNIGNQTLSLREVIREILLFSKHGMLWHVGTLAALGLSNSPQFSHLALPDANHFSPTITIPNTEEISKLLKQNN